MPARTLTIVRPNPLLLGPLLALVLGLPSLGQTITISGPDSGSVGELLTFEASATGCTPAAAGWVWFSDGGQIAGTPTAATIQVNWPSDGSKTLTAANITCGGALGQRTVQLFAAGRIVLTTATTQADEASGSITLAARRQSGSAGAVTVDYFTTDQTASATEDYVAVTGQLSWQDGESGDRLFTIGLLDDAIFEDNETFLVTLDQPSGGAQLGAVTETEVTLLEDDPPPGDLVSFAQGQWFSDEGDGTATIVVRRASDLAGPLTVDFSTSDFTATAGADYLARSETLQWAADDTTDRIIEITLLDDALIEGEETIDLELSNPSAGGFLGVPSFAELILTDDDTPGGPGVLRFSQSTLVTSEGAAASQVEVRRTDGTNGDVAVTVVVSAGSASEGEDFTFSPATLSWSDGDATPRSFSVLVLQDSVQEGDETAVLTLQAPAGGADIGDPAELTVTIQDDDRPATVSFLGESPSPLESALSFNVLVGRGGDISLPAEATVRSRAATARPDEDFEAVDQTLFWSAGDATNRTVTVRLLDDDVVEGDETFELLLTDLVDTTPGVAPTLLVTLRDDDSAQDTISFVESGPLQVTENQGGLAIEIERRGTAALESSVRVRTVAGTAQAGADYFQIDEVLTWPAGDSANRQVSLRAIDDAQVEGDERLTLELLQPTNAILGAATLEVELQDDDLGASGAIGFSSTHFSAAEQDGSLTIELLRTGGDAGSASALVQLVPGSAGRPDDFLDPVSAQVDWGDGSAGSRFVQIPIVNDDVAEATETFQVRLAAVAGAELGSVRVANLSIDDDDANGACGPLNGLPDEDADTLCINQDRFAVDISWRAPNGESGTARPVRLTGDTGYFWIFDEDNVELVVKVLDGCTINDRFWVFATGLTDLEVDLRVTDRLTGASNQIHSPLAQPFRPVLDTDAFAACSNSNFPANIVDRVHTISSETVSASCAPDRPDGTLCLREARFETQLSWQDGDGNRGSGQPAELTADTGTFWIFDPDNIELVVKILDGCSINGHYWVFAGGLTDLATTLTVGDRPGGAVRRYDNQLGVPFEPILDVEAFATCP